MSIFKKVVGAGLVTVMSLGFATGAMADTSGDVSQTNDVDLTIESSTVGNGGLDLSTSPITSFGTIELKANPQTYKTSFEDKFTITDLRGTQDGWSLSVSASPFDRGGHQLPKGSLTLDGVKDIERVGEGVGELPDKKLQQTTVIDDGEVLVLNAEKGKGAGVFDAQFNEDALGLTVDATTAKVGTYESTLTWNLQSTPSAE